MPCKLYVKHTINGILSHHSIILYFGTIPSLMFSTQIVMKYYTTKLELDSSQNNV
ncbi:uncharacterized protein BDR25DRAFT_307002 [Lindgomyces ingoldianus]|uniref:Uncharacterized protein n=1 Tax=Lindgomyces ingoldianus TaxID=673940 RepID=A0ACB6QF19_9PLEO|nr:uncharacterized protein BDR25DRAFT_307002 [Lindgomyces ingoldianus]KAF2464952.1 hypothetical protein BDR25DRAFT_307002 [Lindgomyces ingoldianus]